MSTLFIGKRHYTNRDTLRDRFGRIYKLPWHWSQSGSDVELWLIDYHSRTPASEQHSRLQVRSTPVFGLQILRQLACALVRRPKAIVASGDCYIGLLGYLIARLTGASFTFDIYDKYTTFAGYRKLPGFDPFTFLIRHADHLFFASNALASDILRQPGLRTKAEIVPNGIDGDDFRPRNRSDCRKALGLKEDACYVGYFGSMDSDRGITDLLQAVQLLRERGTDTRLLLAGKNAEDTNLSAPWIDYLGNMAHSEVATALACCNVLALPYRSSEYLDMASSCKIAEYLAVQVPIAATRTPNLCTNFPQQAKELDSALALPHEPDSLASSIIRQLQNPIHASVPRDMTWKEIAGKSLNALAPTAPSPPSDG